MDVKAEEQQIKAELMTAMDKRFLTDLHILMGTQEGRRVFSYIQLRCGFRESLPLGNSRDMFNAGRRSVAIEMLHDVEAIGQSDPLEGVKLRQLAEREYFDFQLRARDHIKHTLSALNKRR